jgi:hypothetical protein
VSDEPSSSGAYLPRRLDGWAPVSRWLENHPNEDVGLLERALMAVQDDTWRDKYRHLDDVTDPRAVIMLLRDDVLMVWRVITEYPNYFRVIFVGSPKDYAF